MLTLFVIQMASLSPVRRTIEMVVQLQQFIRGCGSGAHGSPETSICLARVSHTQVLD
jgi:hypothetical protein